MKIIVLGAGIIGLTTSAQLIENGYNVTICAKKVANLTSHVAAAIWFPYAVAPKNKALNWGKTSYSRFKKLSFVPESGVEMTDLALLYEHNQKEPWWKNAVPSYKTLFNANIKQITPAYGYYKQAYIVPVPLAPMQQYMNYLRTQYSFKIEKKEVTNLLHLFDEYDVVVNCTGIGAKALTNDNDLYPIRGQVVIAKNANININMADEEGPLDVAYIIKRKNDIVLGGTAEVNSFDLNAHIDDATSKEIIRKCKILCPELKKQGVSFEKSLVGLRPGRKEVRIELELLEPNKPVIHNYGHGGAGMTLSWGCASEVLKILQNL